MAETGQYIAILKESLEKKKEILQKLLQENEKQETAVKQNNDMEAFDRTVKAKSRLIRELNGLDEGFEKVYDRIREEFLREKDSYREEIAAMQRLISEITDLSVAIQASEARNQKLVEQYFAYTRGKIRQAKKSVRAASDYYKSMSRTHYVGSQLMDQKK
ncbi:MAG: flagellar export chaperone FlgN [Lachnospiraceae bacterium]|nr:flagellar export chaperone FlgN [Lachnospiraceae bacterium]